MKKGNTKKNEKHPEYSFRKKKRKKNPFLIKFVFVWKYEIHIKNCHVKIFVKQQQKNWIIFCCCCFEQNFISFILFFLMKLNNIFKVSSWDDNTKMQRKRKKYLLRFIQNFLSYPLKFLIYFLKRKKNKSWNIEISLLHSLENKWEIKVSEENCLEK